MPSLIDKIRNGIIGANHSIQTPFGRKPLIYADYTASGRSLDFIEDYIRQQVLPLYANTHSETSATGAATTHLREQARCIIRRAVNAGDDDRVIFCGSGATAAVNRLIDTLGLRLPTDACLRGQLLTNTPEDTRPVVFIGPYEHHSNELPWRESLAQVVAIPLDRNGRIDQQVLAQELTRYQQRSLRIGSFSAASNVTGILSDVAAISRLLHEHGALSCWDYAAAGPYTCIDMNADTSVDAVYVSPHKFIGGPGTPGLLIAKSHLFKYSTPALSGGGTVSWVSPWGHRYVEDRQRREEGGTPGIIEAIRAGLVFKLREEVGVDVIHTRENRYIKRAMQRLQTNPDVDIVGGTQARRLAILSLRFSHAGRQLHHGFVVSLLNDLFGIQARSGCSCAGPYAHHLLAMDRHYSARLDQQIQCGNALLRPGWVRLNFNYFIDEAEFDYLLGAIELIAGHGWRLLSAYHYDRQRGIWCCNEPISNGGDLENWHFADNNPGQSSVAHTPLQNSLHDNLAQAYNSLCQAQPGQPVDPVLDTEAESLRWFINPSEAAALLKQAAPLQKTLS
ncbi:MAG: aminotransferase class V-fold PLP-dependent enzyme [Parahaliea sp.]